MSTYSSTDAPEGYTGNVPKVYPLIDEDTVLEATVLEVKDKVMPFNDRETGQPVVKVAFTFAVTYDDDDGRKVWGEVWPEFYHHPDCQLHAWTQEILGADLPPEFVLNTDDLVGLTCRVIVGINRYTRKSDGVKKENNYVKDVLRSSTPATASVGAGAPAYEDPF